MTRRTRPRTTFTFAAAPAGPAITLTPNSNVANNSAITVDGTGFPVADTTAFIVECGDTSGAATCDTTNVVTAPLTAGAFTGASITVKTGSLGTSGSCAAAGTCYIAVSSSVGTHDATNSTASTFTFGTTAVPAITVTPHNGLKNGDSVVVSGTGYPAAASVVVIECSANPPTGPADCDITDIPGHLATTDGSGAFTKSITMKTGPIGGGTCSVGSTNCSVAAGTTDQLHKAYAPVVFAGATGPQASANHETNVKDGETLKISGSGFPKKVNPLYILECSTKTCGTQGSNGNLGTGILGTKSTTANGTFSKLPLKVQEGKFGSASCKAGGKCYIAVATSTDPTPSESALITFTFAKGGASHGPAKTKTIAAFSKKKDAIGGVVRSAGKGVKGLKTKLEIKAGKKWKKVAAHKTHKGGVFLYKHIKKNGKYKVVTAKTKHYKASSSKTLKVKLA